MTTQTNPLVDALDLAAGKSPSAKTVTPRRRTTGNPLVDSLDQTAASQQSVIPPPSSLDSTPGPGVPSTPSIGSEITDLYHQYVAAPVAKAAKRVKAAVTGPQEIQAVNLNQPPAQVQALEQQRQQQQQQTQDRLDTPIADVGKLAQSYIEGTQFQQEHPYRAGAAEALAGAVGAATSPSSLATLGAFMTAPEAGIAGIAKKLVTLGWSAEQANDAANQVYGAYKAYKSGDAKTAGKMIATGIANAAMAALGTHYSGTETAPAIEGATPSIRTPAGEVAGADDIVDQPPNPQQTAAQSQAPATAQPQPKRARKGSVQVQQSPAEEKETEGPPLPSMVGPEEEPLAPETPETLQAQVEALKDGTNPAVYIPKGQEYEGPPVPEGFESTEVKGDEPGAGTYLHDPDVVSSDEIKEAAENGDHGKVLGYTQSKEDAITGSQPAVIVARDENGTELKAAAVDAGDPGAVGAQTDALRQQFPKAASIGLEQPEKTLASRAKKSPGIDDFFKSAKGAVTDAFARDAWDRLSSGKKLLFSEKAGTTESRVQRAFDAGQISGPEDIAALVGGKKSVPRAKPSMSVKERLEPRAALTGPDELTADLKAMPVPKGGWTANGIQREMRVGYGRATKILKELQKEEGTPPLPEHLRPRERMKSPKHLPETASTRRSEGGFVSGEMLRDIANGKIAREAGQRITDDILKLGDKYNEIRKSDPELADRLQTLDSARTYFHAKAEANLKKVAGKLSRAQERLAALMSDTDSRENLRLNHPSEYQQALHDPAVTRAVEAYKPLERELTQLRQTRGGQVLDRDYLRRVYDEHVSGIGSTKGKSEEGAAAFDRVIRPSKPLSASREASAEYFHENGLHEFGPAYGTKYTGEKIAALRDDIARNFMGKATKIDSGAELPRSIQYQGKTFYRPDVAAEMKRGTPRFEAYDPNAGIRTAIVDRDAGDVTFGRSASKYLGPSKIVDTLRDYDANSKLGETGKMRTFFRQQIVGFGFGIPHIANIERRVMQSFHGGVANPRAWAAAWKVAFDRGLKDRALRGVDDPRYDTLLKNGGLSTGEIRGYKQYAGGNFNPANWGKVGHDLIFKQGGIDQRARLYVADLVKSQRPEIADAELAREINKQLGDYNRGNWTDRQKLLSKFMLFPGWDTSSTRWVLQHPIRTTVPPAMLTLLANQVVHQLGGNKNEDQFDITGVHVGDRKYSTGLVKESLANSFYRPILNFTQSKIQGESNTRAAGEAGRGVANAGAGLIGMLNPLISGFGALVANRQSFFTGKEIVGRTDDQTPGKILPTVGLEKRAAFVARQFFPGVNRAFDSDENVDPKAFIGGNLSVTNYRSDAASRLARNAGESSRVYSVVNKLAKEAPAEARDYLKDPDNAVLALFHNDFGQMAAAVRKIDAATKAIADSKLPDDDKAKRTKPLEDLREKLLQRADVLDTALFWAKRQLRQKSQNAPVQREEAGSPPLPSF